MTASYLDDQQEQIAVIGMAGRFPGAGSVAELWRNLCDAVESISFFTEKDHDPSTAIKSLLNNPRYIPARGVLKDIELFDALFFGCNPKESEILDPQQRIFLECAWEALEDAGYDADRHEGLIGVYAGAAMSTYLELLYSNPEALASISHFQLLLSNDKDHLATRTSYKLNLKGPAVTIQTACSTSLVAVHLACQGLLYGECDMALAGGVSINIPQNFGYFYQEGGIVSPDGHCRAFDAEAQGTVSGNGAGLVVLKRLSDALADGDNIYAIIKGSAINNDGNSKVGYTAPSIDGQAKAIAEALAVARVEPQSISYIEAHGTGTSLGDPIEISALNQVFKSATDRKGFCAIGSIKTNLGHLDAAAGVAGLIKTVLALKHRQLPASLHFRTPNPKIDFANSPFYVNSQLRDWTTDGAVRRAGVSSFGIGGTNAHVVVEQAPEPVASGESRDFQLVALSAKTKSAVDEASRRLAQYLEENSGVKLADVAYTLQQGRKEFGHRRAVVCGSLRDAIEELSKPDARRQNSGKPTVVYLMSGQGTQYAGMGRKMYEKERRYREEVDRCAEVLRAETGEDIREAMRGEGEEATNRLNQTDVTQAALFVLEYSLAKQWEEWGVKAEAMIGHSIGEYVAATLAGVMELEEALKVIAARGSLMQRLPCGVMLAVPLSEDGVKALLGDSCCIAAINGPARCVISGAPEQAEDWAKLLDRNGVAYKRLRTSHAFHSEMMTPILSDFRKVMERVRLEPPKIPFISNVTGTWIEPQEATDPAYWAKHLRQTVRFSEGLEEILKEQNSIFLEIGPGNTLSTWARQRPGRSPQQIAASSLPSFNDDRDDQAFILEQLGHLWVAGVNIDWTAFSQYEKRRRCSLPTYPFERKRYWVEPSKNNGATRANALRLDEPADQPSKQSNGWPTADLLKGREEIMGAPVRRAESERRNKILSALGNIISQLVGISLAEVNTHTSFVEMGVDSLLLIQANQMIQDKFNVKVSLVQLLEELKSIDELASYIDRELPPDAFIEEDALEETIADSRYADLESVGPKTPRLDASDITSAISALQDQAKTRARDEQSIPAGGIDGILSRLDIIISQLDLLRSEGGSDSAAPAKIKKVPLKQYTSQRETSSEAGEMALKKSFNVAAPETKGASTVAGQQPFIAYHPAQPGSRDGLTPLQQQYLSEFIARYTDRTRESKRLTQSQRRYLADNRASSGFRMAWKEMLYPIIGERSSGSKLWDVDGNQYLDITMGFGAYLFGHSPQFITQALEQQLKLGIQVGPQSLRAGEVAQLLNELAGVDRATFCNSGTEAVMAAIRIARAVSGRRKIAIFSGYYHGSFDVTLARGMNSKGKLRSVPMAPGVMQGMVDDTLVLDYDSPESLSLLEHYAGELAAVLVEPVQSRRPDVQPKQFLRDLRSFTERNNVVLIFDEVITGFRIAPGGAQEWFGVRSDLVTYGKILGGGMPIGVVAGKAECIGAIDGGMWNFGDDSYPRQEKTFFAGTFCKHPLTMAASLAVLKHLKAEGRQLQQTLNQRTSRLAVTLNAFFEQEEAPVRLVNFGSLFRFLFSNEMKYPDLFLYHLVSNGVYVWEGNTCFLSTAHTEEDVEFLVDAVKRSIREMRSGGFLPRVTSSPAPEDDSKEEDRRALAISSSESEVKVVPATESQKQLWVLAQMGEDACRAYNESLTLHLRGRLNIAAMQRAIQRLVDRHEAMRTCFTANGELQKIAPFVTIEVPVEDLSDTELSERDQLLKQWVSQEARKIFDIERGPLMRARLAKIEDERHILALTIHHIVTDGWSVAILLNDLRQLYSSEETGTVCNLASPFQFSEFALRQQIERQSAEADAARSYWLNQFSPPISALDLPTDRPRPPVMTYNGDRFRYTIDSAVYNGLKRLSAQRGCTLFMTLLSAFELLMHYLTNQDDLVVGMHSAGQLSTGTTNLVGMCLNILPVRSRLVEGATFTEHLASVKKFVIDAYNHQSYSFMSMVRELNIPRDPARLPLVSVMFNLDRLGPPMSFSGLEVDVVSNSGLFARFEIFWNVVETDRNLLIECDYNTDLLNASTVELMLERYEVILEAVVANPNLKLSQFPMLTPQEQQQIIVEWNDTAVPYQESLLIHELFERQAQERPDQIAVIYEQEEISYQELNRRSEELANYLSSQGVGAETVVGICMERSVEIVVALLGILKSGGAYMPIEPDLPEERIAYMVREAGAMRVVVGSGAKQKPELKEVEKVVAGERNTGKECERRKKGEVEGDNLVYVIYTSGSTGSPKGVMISHRGILNRIQWMQNKYRLMPDDRVLQKTPFIFDVSVWEFFLPLITGATLVLARPGGHRDSRYLADLIIDRQITVTHFVPSMLQVFLQEPGIERCSSLKLVICSGEALPRDLQERFYERMSAELHNLYGPTEASVDVTSWACKRSDSQLSVPIGKPISNTQIYVLDRYLKPVPVGVKGDLYIGGVGVARGYIGRPDLTAERFIPNPLGEHGSRLYKTGDLAKLLSDGNIEFLGRADNQIKIRGNRIELGEIEAAISQHQAIREAVVVAQQVAGQDKRLVAYIVSDDNQAASVEELKKYLRRKLPDYMVPGLFVKLERMPLTVNGKIDRKSLPEAEAVAAEDRPYTAPRNEVEEVIAGIWSEVLKAERVGVKDNFFEIGGHSLLATRAASRMREIFGVELGLREMFEQPTIAGLAQRVEAMMRAGEGLEAPPIRAVDRRARLPLSFAQERMWFLYQMEPGNPFYNITVAVRVEGGLSIEAIENTMTEVVRRHEVLRTRFDEEEGVGVQVIEEASRVKVPVIDISEMSQHSRREEEERLLREGANEAFDLRRGKVIRSRVIEVGKREQILQLTMHHIATDGWSMEVMVREVARLYEEYRRGEESRLKELEIQYGDYAVWQREWLRGEALDRQMRYWKRELESAPAGLELATDRPRPAVQSYRGARLQFDLNPEQVSLLKAVSRAEGASLFMVLLAGFKVLLHYYSGQEDLVVGVPVAGRNRVELEPMIGFFVNTLVMRSRVNEGKSFRELLTEVREMTLGAFAHQDLPFEKLVKELRVERIPGYSPLFQVSFSFQSVDATPGGSGDEEAQRSNRAIQHLEIDDQSAQFDLVLQIISSQDRMMCNFQYNTDLYTTGRIKHMAALFKTLMETVGKDAGQGLDRIKEELALAEKQQRELDLQDAKRARKRMLDSARLKALGGTN